MITTMNKLDLTKKVQTRDGRPVEIISKGARNETCPIVGYIDKQRHFSFWTLSGDWCGHGCHENDLINAPEWHLPDPPKPKLIEVQLCADDIKAGDEFLSPSGRRYQWLYMVGDMIQTGESAYSLEFMFSQGWKIRSIGETEWRKCSRMEEVPA
jgi:hypothetical protein